MMALDHMACMLRRHPNLGTMCIDWISDSKITRIMTLMQLRFLRECVPTLAECCSKIVCEYTWGQTLVQPVQMGLPRGKIPIRFIRANQQVPLRIFLIGYTNILFFHTNTF